MNLIRAVLFEEFFIQIMQTTLTNPTDKKFIHSR